MTEKAKRALLSVANKEGLVDFARGLQALGFEIVSSGGTAKALEAGGLRVERVSDVTGFPEILDGRVKTLHPKIHGGLLARRELASHREALEAQGISPVDVVAVNFYPFEEKVASGSPLADIIENIDIGGPAMLRAASKNFEHVAPVVDPRDYPLVLSQLADGLDLATRLYLAVKAFRASARYERAIASFMSRLSVEQGELGVDEEESDFPNRLVLQFEKVQDLRYGENPHQPAAFYRDSDEVPVAVAGARKLHGKELSYNNILDLDAAWRLSSELGEERPGAVIIKHTNPCGAALADQLEDAYRKARATDPVSAFGSIVAFNRTVDGATARELGATFIEAIIAPGFSAEALDMLTKKKALRLLAVDDPAQRQGEGFNLCRVQGGLLVQGWDRDLGLSQLEVVTERKPSDDELAALSFAWAVSKHVKSNAIVLANQDALVGVGAGQMSRVDSCRLAITKAEASENALDGSVAASDAFFPFRDGLDTLADAGVTAVIQPGGSIRDDEVITAANERGVAMVFTGVRHFRH